MISTEQLIGQRVYQLPAAGKETNRKGKPRTASKLGKVHNVVFGPSGKQVVGVQVKQPDIAGMVRRPDVFVALDRLKPYAGADVPKPGYAFVAETEASDKAALKRLGIDYDRCIIWVGMDVRTSDGKNLGFVSSANFDEQTGEVESFSCGDGGAANALIGSRVFGQAAVLGYRDGYMVVRPEAAGSGFSGGLAEKAGAAAGQAQVKAAEVGEKASVAASKAGKVAGEAANKGARSLGKQLGRTKGMFSSFKEEFDKASKG